MALVRPRMVQETSCAAVLQIRKGRHECRPVSLDRVTTRSNAAIRVEIWFLIFALDLLYNNSVLTLGRDIKFLSRYLCGFLFIGSLNRAETFGAMPEDIDTPTSHQRKTFPLRLG